MKFGILQFFSWPQRRVPLATVYERALQRIEIMDRSGYDAVWLTEHHFSDYSVCPSIPVMGAHVAARTKNLRIGAGVTLAAFIIHCGWPKKSRFSIYCRAGESVGELGGALMSANFAPSRFRWLRVRNVFARQSMS